MNGLTHKVLDFLRKRISIHGQSRTVAIKKSCPALKNRYGRFFMEQRGSFNSEIGRLSAHNEVQNKFLYYMNAQ